MSAYYKTIHAVIHAGHSITDQISEALEEFEMSEPQYNVLRILKGAHGEPISLREIQQNMVQRSSNVSRIIDKLLSKKYVDRKECTDNRRKLDISLTEKGRLFLRKLNKKVAGFHRPIRKKFTGSELETFRKLIKKLNPS